MDKISKSIQDNISAQKEHINSIVKGSEFKKIEIEYRGDSDFIEMLYWIKTVGGVGHSFSIIVDPDADKRDKIQGKPFKGEFGFDGDGSDYIKSIKVDGVEFKSRKK